MTATDAVLRERIEEALRDIAVSWRWMSEGPHEADLADAADALLPVVADVVAERDRLAAEVARVREYVATSDDDGVRTRETILGIVGELPDSALDGAKEAS